MWVGIEGIPGSGKSYEAVAFHILPALKNGRKVITNLPLEIEQIRIINPDWVNHIEVRGTTSWASKRTLNLLKQNKQTVTA